MILWNNDNICVLLTTQVVRWIIFNENVSISIPISSPMKWEFEHHVLVISHSGYDLLSHLENIIVSWGGICLTATSTIPGLVLTYTIQASSTGNFPTFKLKPIGYHSMLLNSYLDQHYWDWTIILMSNIIDSTTVLLNVCGLPHPD